MNKCSTTTTYKKVFLLVFKINIQLTYVRVLKFEILISCTIVSTKKIYEFQRPVFESPLSNYHQ